MKALSIKQPWASLICTPRSDNPQLGIKDIENRTWRTNFRGTVMVHASAKPAKIEFEIPGQATAQEIFLSSALNKFEEDELFSCIIGKVDIVDCVIGYPSVWAEKGMANGKQIYNWVLANPVLYEKPIRNIKGKLSFWEPTPNQFCMNCDEPYFGSDPEYCCTGKDCGCLGLPIEPAICYECYNKLCAERKCRVCGCTENDCRQCINKTGFACHWVAEDLCSACEGE